MKRTRITPGVEREVFAIVRSGKDAPLFEEELYPLISEAQRDKVETYIQHLADVPAPIQNSNAIKKLKGVPNLWELIPKPVRLFFFFVHKQAVITTGFVKKQNKTPKEEIARAQHLMMQYMKEEDI